jgi:two-component SAPR family response regulator
MTQNAGKITAPIKQGLDNATFDVLIIDNDPEVLSLLKRVLKKSGRRVKLAINEIEGLVMMSVEKYQIAFIDAEILQRSLNNGMLKELTREGNLKTKICILGNPDAATVNTKSLDIMCFLGKPLKENEIQRVIDNFKS